MSHILKDDLGSLISKIGLLSDSDKIILFNFLKDQLGQNEPSRSVSKKDMVLDNTSSLIISCLESVLRSRGYSYPGRLIAQSISKDKNKRESFYVFRNYIESLSKGSSLRFQQVCLFIVGLYVDELIRVRDKGYPFGIRYVVSRFSDIGKIIQSSFPGYTNQMISLVMNKFIETDERPIVDVRTKRDNKTITFQ